MSSFWMFSSLYCFSAAANPIIYIRLIIVLPLFLACQQNTQKSCLNLLYWVADET